MSTRTTLRHQVLTALREQIVDGRRRSGTHLSEVELALSFDVSRSTVREALRVLQQEGLVEGHDRRRLSVRRFDVREITDLFDSRAALECWAAQSIMSSPAVDDLLDALRAALPAEHAEPDQAKALDADLAFHEQLMILAGNATLLELWRVLGDRTRLLVLGRALPQRTRDLHTASAHADLLAALESGDIAGARVAFTHHMRRAASRCEAEALAMPGPSGEV